jgi:hypothetical protein
MEKHKRLETLIHVLEKKPFVSKQIILDYFNDFHDMDLSARTLERDFQSLAIDYHITVNYCHTKRGYHLMFEDSDQITSFLSFTGRVYLAELFRKGLKDFQDLRKSIKLEDHSDFKGIERVEPIFMAIQQGRIVEFTHENYLKKTLKQYRIAPLQLREYQGRWYMIGVPLVEDDKLEDNAIIKSFGLARITQLKTTEVSPISELQFDHQLQKFEQIIGLNYDEAEQRENIEIAVSPNQYKYLESLPVHASQYKKGEDKDGRIIISIHLIPNYELKMQILKLGAEVEVIRPQYLRDEIVEILKQSLKIYQNGN